MRSRVRRIPETPDVCISHTAADRPWAAWIAWVLEAAGYSTVVDASDDLEERAAPEATTTLAVVTPAFVRSRFWEWNTTLPPHRLVLVQVEPAGVAAARAGALVDLVGLGEGEARRRLLDALASVEPTGRAPSSAGPWTMPARPSFPGPRAERPTDAPPSPSRTRRGGRHDVDVPSRADRVEEPVSPLQRLVRAEASGAFVRRRHGRESMPQAPTEPQRSPAPPRYSPAPPPSWDRDETVMPPSLPDAYEPSEPGAMRPVRMLSLARIVGGIAVALAAGGAVVAIVRWLLGGAIEGPASQVDDVDVTVFSAEQASPGESLLIQVFAHLPEQADRAQSLATAFDKAASPRDFDSLALPLAFGSTLAFELDVPGLAVDERCQTLRWRGRAASVQFGVTVPVDAQPGTRVGTLLVSQDSVPVGHIKFKLVVAPPRPGVVPEPERPVGDDARAYESAFVSYAREDRAEVLRRVQVLRLVKVRCFQDLLDLDPGERWERRLYREIDRSDVLLLFWSTAAHGSVWVRKEVAYALARKQTEFDAPEIVPVILEVPPCPPWPELDERQFDDVVARLIAAEG